MAWSTRQLAELAGTTVKTVRHYHRIGLLAEPERAANGYKRYEVGHLVRLLRIRRLVDLGVSLSDVAAIDESDESAEETLRALDAELAASIERQQRMRADLAEVVRQRELLDLPPGFDPSAAETSEANRSLLLLYSRVYGPEAMDAVRELSALPAEPLDTEFATLTEDADEDTRQRLAERIAPNVHQQFERFPVLRNPAALSPRGKAFANAQVVKGLVEMYNVAQLDVLRRVDVLVRKADES